MLPIAWADNGPELGAPIGWLNASATDRRWIFERWRMNQVAAGATESTKGAAERGQAMG